MFDGQERFPKSNDYRSRKDWLCAVIDRTLEELEEVFDDFDWQPQETTSA